MSSAFFEPTDDPTRFATTSHCSSAWSATLQHGGPPSALLVRTVEACPSSIDGPTQIARFTVDIFGPLPIAEVTLGAHVLRPGRRVELVEARLEAGGRVAMVARAWRMRTAELDLPVPGGVVAVQRDVPGFPHGPVHVPPIPEHAATPYNLDIWNRGYAAAVDWRFVVGGPEGGQPATVWARPRIDLVAGEVMTPISRLLLLADTGNGLSRVLDIDTWWFINTELTVHVHRQPSSEWILLAARSTVESNGTGMTETELYDEHGRVGRAAQALMVGPR
jgi:acyl-Coa thioesterase superfamily protein/acyl-CoA thioesterase superfamily protein